jgi:DNA-binding CsgD family transcriptional regulator
VLVGREAEHAFVRELIDSAGDGQGAVLLVSGEPGIGKSALLDACIADARTRGSFVLDAQCDALGRARPFGPVLDAAARAGLVVEHPAAEPEPSPDGPPHLSPFETGPELRTRLLDTIARAIEARCAQSAVALVVDDVHWADRATLLLLTSLARRSADLGLLLVVAHRPVVRPSDLGSFFDALDRAEQRRLVAQRHIVLTALDESAAATIGETIAGGPLGPALGGLVARCDGNPLLVAELVGALQASGALVTVDGYVELQRDDTTGPLPANFRETVRTRMANLEGDARAVAAIAAVLGTQFTIGELGTATQRTASSLMPVVEGLLDTGLLVDTEHALQFRHDLVREAVAESMPTALRTELHRAIGDSLRAANAPLSRVAEHVALGAAPGSQDAVNVLRLAASEISSQDPDGAVRLLRRALEICAPTDAQRDHLLAQLVDALAWSGRINEAETDALAVLARPVAPEVEQWLRSALGRALLLLGRPREAVPHEQRLVELHEILGQSPAWPYALCAACRIFATDLDGALADAARAIELGERDNEPMGEILGLCVDAFGRNALADSATALASATRAVELADRTPGGEGHRLHPHLYRAVTLLTLGERDAALAGIAQGRLLGEAIGARWALPTYHFVTALAHWDSGAWDDLFAEVDAGVELGEEQSSSIAQVWAYAIVGRVQLYRSDLAGAEATLDDGDALLANAGPQIGVDWLAHSRALLLDAQGKRHEGIELLRLAWAAATSLQASASLLLFGPDLARLAVEDGDEELADTVAAALDAIAARSPSDALASARATLVRGITERDADLVHDAAVAIDKIGHPFEAAQARAHAASLLAVAGKAADAVAMFESALAAFETLAAHRESDRVHAQLSVLRRSSARSARRARRATVGWDALTTTELEVVEEVCSGRSNPEVAHRLGISRRTVEAHLRSIYTKLGVRTRLALAVAVHERTGDTPP